MARSIKIEELLLQQSHPFDVGKARQTVSGWKDSASSGQPTSRPDLVVNTSTSVVHSNLSAIDRFTWEPDKQELTSTRHRKRKSPVERDDIPTKKPVRLPRFSVNVFHTEPVNVFPIPAQGCVPRMVKYCEHRSSPSHDLF